MLNGLDLFSGIGGISLALSDWVRPIVYCENDRYAQGVLMSKMRSGDLASAPIWPDVRTLQGEPFAGGVDILYGGFPCQDISAAGLGRGLVGERSGLYWQIERLVRETNPQYVFLENVPAIRTRGLNTVVQSLTELGYDCRWTVISASELGAPHIRKRWFLLAHANSDPIREQSRRGGRPDGKGAPELGPIGEDTDAAAMQRKAIERGESNGNNERSEALADPLGEGQPNIQGGGEAGAERAGRRAADGSSWWNAEPDVGRVADGVQNRVDRLRGLGNAVVPAQAREAFMRLMGLDMRREVK